MIPGFNHNIKHKGRIFHIQTEDSGPKNPHIITHLFVGGNIVSSKKTEYHDIVGKPEYERAVRSMMEEQHKQMLRNLVNGVFDAVDSGVAYHLDGPAPLNFTSTSPNTAAIAGGDAFKGLPSQARPGPVSMPPHSTLTGSAHTGSTHTGSAQTGSAQTGNALAGMATTIPRALTPLPGGVHVQTPPPSAQLGPTLVPEPARPAPAAPSSFAPPSGTLFGEDLISEKSLDEVILSYLAEDLLDDNS